jgi:hypothetical protein
MRTVFGFQFNAKFLISHKLRFFSLAKMRLMHYVAAGFRLHRHRLENMSHPLFCEQHGKIALLKRILQEAQLY